MEGTAELAASEAANRREYTPSFALRSSRVPRYNLTLPADLLRVKYGSGNRHHWNLGQPPLRAAPLYTHQASRQSSLHHLPVRRAACQLGCPDMWQKHHEPPPTVIGWSDGMSGRRPFLPRSTSLVRQLHRPFRGLFHTRPRGHRQEPRQSGHSPQSVSDRTGATKPGNACTR